MRIGIPNEGRGGKTLVAATPDTVEKLVKLGFSVCVEAGAGIAANYPDEHYERAGAEIVVGAELWVSDIIVSLDAPQEEQIAQMKAGATLVSRLNPGANPQLVDRLAKQGVTALAMDMVPRISRAQSLDVRSSMANVGGYRAVIEAATHFGRLFGGQVTAAGKIAPAKVYIIGVGVAGLAAIGTAKSMGAIVRATDVRPEVADQVESLNAEFVPIPVVQHSDDGYAKEMTADQAKLANKVYAEQAAEVDIVITTAQIPGKQPPLLLDAEAVAGMRPGSVIIDMGANEKGGNCALTRADEVVTTENGVTIIGYTDLPSRLPSQASQLYGQNIVNFFKLVTPEKDGNPVYNQEDEVVRGVTAVLEGQVCWPPPAVKVSAAPKPDAVEPAAGTDASDQGALDTGAPAQKTAFARHWWKAVAAVLGAALILAAPAEMASHFIVFELACVVGFYVITNVTHALHTPLMSVTNAISGIIVVGSLTQIGSDSPVIAGVAFVAALLASINIFGGFLVTHRMLGMFRRSSED